MSLETTLFNSLLALVFRTFGLNIVYLKKPYPCFWMKDEHRHLTFFAILLVKDECELLIV